MEKYTKLELDIIISLVKNFKKWTTSSGYKVSISTIYDEKTGECNTMDGSWQESILQKEKESTLAYISLMPEDDYEIDYMLIYESSCDIFLGEEEHLKVNNWKAALAYFLNEELVRSSQILGIKDLRKERQKNRVLFENKKDGITIISGG